MQDISNNADVIDVRDITERFEELRDELFDDSGNQLTPGWDTETHAEYEAIDNLLGELKGNGGDHQWRGDWFPVTLIRDSYFVTYAQELAEDLTSSEARSNWPFKHIDWEAAAEALRVDYSDTDYNGVTYWYR